MDERVVAEIHEEWKSVPFDLTDEEVEIVYGTLRCQIRAVHYAGLDMLNTFRRALGLKEVK